MTNKSNRVYKLKKNDYKIVDNYVIIYSKKKSGEIFEIYIDLEDFEKAKEFTWRASWHKIFVDIMQQQPNI